MMALLRYDILVKHFGVCRSISKTRCHWKEHSFIHRWYAIIFDDLGVFVNEIDVSSGR